MLPLSTPQDFKVTSGPEKRDRKLVLRADTEANRDEWVESIRQGISAIKELERAFEQEYGEKRSARTNSASKELTRHLSIRRQKSDANLTKAKCEPEKTSLEQDEVMQSEPIFDAKKTWKSACTKTQAMLRFRKGGEKAWASSLDVNAASILPLDGQLASFEASQGS